MTETAKKPNAAEPEKVRITIELPPFAEDIGLNGVHYQHGHSYDVTPQVYASLKDIMARAQEHEDARLGHGRHVRGIVGQRKVGRQIRGF